MCGITGILDLQGLRPIDRTTLVRMNEAQLHRGPDGDGLFVAPGVGLGHRRLAIIDVAMGHQPLFNEDHTVCVVFNGEIFNYRELIAELVALGHVFRTRSDTEVIVHGWEQWGDACVTRFRGMFAFALWDANRETLFLARDRLGVKPLHYATLADGTLIFGSELKSLLAHGGLARDLDPQAIEEYFALGYVPEPRTIFRAARKLPAGHCLVVRRGQPIGQPQQYWDLQFSQTAKVDLEAACEELNLRLRESVELRMISEVPLGAFLSGGVDSSAVVAMMAELSPHAVNTCSIGFDDPEYDETRYAQMVAAHLNTGHGSRIVSVDDFDLIDQIAGIYDEPFADSSAIPTYRVCQLARERVTVALSGDGGDELLGGYRRYQTHLRQESLRAMLPNRVGRLLFGGLARAYDVHPARLRGAATVRSLASDPVDAYFREMSVLPDELRRDLYSDKLLAELGGYRGVEVFRRHARATDTSDALGLVQYLDYKTYLPDDINVKVDRASMAHSLEVREPLMDHPLVEWAATLPANLKIRGSEGKYLLKKALEPKLPAEILYRSKRGFAVPLARWFRGPLKARVNDALFGKTLLGTNLFKRTALRKIVDEHQNGGRDHSAAIWSLLVFESFLRKSTDFSAASERGTRASGAGRT